MHPLCDITRITYSIEGETLFRGMCIACTLGWTNLSKSGPYDPTFFSWVWVHALMAVRTLTLSLVKYLCDAVDFCETAQLPL